MDIIDKTIGRYEIKELIGEGAMAEVYRAYDPGINRSLALKVLKQDFCVDNEYLSRFLREAKAAGALNHQNIVTVYDVGEIENSPYIMMELLDGQTLGHLLEVEFRLPIEQTLIIAIQLAKALDYAHRAGVVHRDIKPENIVIQPDGESVKVADFGIARMNEREESQKTQIGSVLGTPRYMSPEQALGESVDGRADLFAVGVVMYEMLTGNKAFDSDSIGTLMTQIISKQPRPVQEYCPELPAGLRQIIQKLLQKKPEKRFQTGEKLANALAKELAAFREQQEEQKKQQYVPLKVRWSIYMGCIVAVVLAISMVFVFNIQSRSMTAQAVDSGAAFAKFIAIETAVPLLSEDWISLETFIQEASGRETFDYLIVTDRQGVIRGASDDSMVGSVYETHQSATRISESSGVVTSSRELDGGRKVFDIEAPVLFQNTEVGNIVLGLSQEGLDAVKRVTRWLMFSLALVTISSVVLVLFIFGGLIAVPLKALAEMMHSFGSGNYDARVSLQRDDEIGELFRIFNDMASNVQSALSADSGAEAPAGTLEDSVLDLSQIDRPSDDSDNATVVAMPGDIDVAAAAAGDATMVLGASDGIDATMVAAVSDGEADAAAAGDATVVAMASADAEGDATRVAMPDDRDDWDDRDDRDDRDAVTVVLMPGAEDAADERPDDGNSDDAVADDDPAGEGASAEDEPEAGLQAQAVSADVVEAAADSDDAEDRVGDVEAELPESIVAMTEDEGGDIDGEAPDDTDEEPGYADRQTVIAPLKRGEEKGA